MASLNRVMIIGNLGESPELRYTQGKNPVATLNVATNTVYKDRQTGEQKTNTQWHKVSVWGKQAESCAKYLQKGSGVFVEGSLQTNEWEDREGNRRWSTEIRANRVQFLGSGTSGTTSEDQNTPSDGDFSDDELPF